MKHIYPLIVLSLSCQSSPSAEPIARKAGVDWAGFLGPTGNGISPETGILKEWPKTGLKVLWEAEMGMGYAPPVISEGRLFHFDRFGDSARLTCRQSETGKFVWKFEYPTNYKDYYNFSPGPRCCPMVDGDRVYIYGPEGMLHCLAVADGKEIWKVDTVAKFNVHQNFFGVGCCPIVEGDLLIAQVGGSPPGNRPDDFMTVKGNGTGIVAFDKKTGDIRWQATDELASYSSPVLATIDGRRWGFVLARGGLVAFNPKDGKVDFQFPWRTKFLESVNASNPVVVGDRVFITECYQLGGALLKVAPGKQEVVWSDKDKVRDKSLACHWNTPIYTGGYLYGCNGRHENSAELRCVDWKTGEVQWAKKGLSRSSLTMVDGHFLCWTEEGILILFEANPKAYVELTRWKTDLDPPCWAAPVVSHGLMYLRGKDRLICCELIPKK